jgi:hypothetical protein
MPEGGGRRIRAPGRDLQRGMWTAESADASSRPDGRLTTLRRYGPAANSTLLVALALGPHLQVGGPGGPSAGADAILCGGGGRSVRGGGRDLVWGWRAVRPRGARSCALSRAGTSPGRGVTGAFQMLPR